MIRYVFGADTKPFKDGLNDMRSRVQRFASSAAVMMAKAFAIAAIIAGFRSLINELDRAAKMAVRFGTTAQDIQRVGKAAELAGQNVETVVRTLTRGVRAAAEAARGTDTYADAFDRLGINAEAFAKMQPTEQLLELSKAAKNAGGVTNILADGMIIFGRNFAEVAALLNQDPDALAHVFNNASVAADNAIAAAVKYKDTMVEVGDFFRKILLTIMQAFLTVKTAFTDIFNIMVITLAAAMEQAAALAKATKRVFSGDWSGAVAAFREGTRAGEKWKLDMIRNARQTKAEYDKIWSSPDALTERTAGTDLDLDAIDELIDKQNELDDAQAKADAERMDRLRRLADLTKQVNDAMEAARIKALSDEQRLIELKERELELQKQINDEGLGVEAQLEAGKDLIAVANERRDIEDAARKRQEDHDAKMSDLRTAEIDAQQDLAFSRMTDEEKLQDLVARRNKLMEDAGDDDTEDAIQQRIAALGLDREIDRMVDAMRDGKGGMTTPGSIAATGLAAIGGGGSANLLAAGTRNHEQTVERLLAGILAGVTTGDDGNIKQYREPVA